MANCTQPSPTVVYGSVWLEHSYREPKVGGSKCLDLMLQCFYVWNSLVFVISYSVCPVKPFQLSLVLMGKPGSYPRVDHSGKQGSLTEREGSVQLTSLY